MAYSTPAELTQYASDRGITLTGDTAVLLTLASDYIEGLTYKGVRTDSTQITAWPRDGVYVDNILIDSAVVPQGIKNAEMQSAVEIDRGNDPLSTLDRAVKREKIDVIETEYMDNTAESTILRSVTHLLAPYLANTGGMRVDRA